MNFRLSIVLNAFIMTLGSFVLAQEMPEVIPPTPEAASLGKFTEVPISHYTGLPNISIPITSFDVGGKPFPVSLSYHARGIQVSETASRVGLGWALNAGGQITRQVRMKADDDSYGYFGSSIISDFANLPSDPAQVASYLDSCCSSTGSFDPDKIPDQFSLQVGNLSAKFFFDYKDFKPLVQKYDDIIIKETGTPGSLSGFIVIDKDGFKYTFSSANIDFPQDSYIFTEDTSTYTINSSSANPTINSWVLSSIVSPNGDLANFFYDQEITYAIRRSHDQENPDPQGMGDYICHASRTKITEYLLSEIRYDYSDSGSLYKKIVFDSVDTRQDVRLDGSTYPKELDAIKIYDRHGTLISTYVLHHSYMNSTDTSNYHELLVQLDNSSSKRLVLDSIVQIGRNNTKKPPYKFTYNSTVLPNRFSNSQDFWGYYNGANNGRFLTFTGASRVIDTTLAEAGMLKKITYPTGGSTRFTYEHNKGFKGPEYDDIVFPDINPTALNDEVRLTHFGTAFYNGDAYVRDFTLGPVSGLATINIDLPDWTNLPGSPNPGHDQDQECANPTTSECKFSIQLENLDNSTVYQLYTNSSPLNLPQGNYRLTVDPLVGNWQLPPFSPQESLIYSFLVSLSWDEQVVGQNGLLYSSGKRIKQIEFLDSGDNVVSKKTYDYNESGLILSIPYFAVPHPSFGHLGGLIGGPAIPGSPFNTYQGNTIGYRFVEEYLGDKDNNIGKTSYRFIVTRDTGDYLSHPVTPPTDNEWLRGLPYEVVHYKVTGNGSYKAVKKTETTYLTSNKEHTDILPLPLEFPGGTPNNLLTPESLTYHIDSIPQILPDVFYQKTDTSYRLPFVHRYRLNNISGQNPYYIKIYHRTGGTLDTGKNLEILYDENELPTLVTETTTDFDYGKHYQPAKVTSVTSDGIPVIQTFTYPQDLESNYTVHPATYDTNPIRALAEQHRFVALENNTFKDLNSDGSLDLSERLSRTKTIYDWDGDILEPILVQTAKNIEALQDRIEFKDYDGDGNILQVSKTDGMDITYIYGYDNTLPVAKIENATYSQVQSHVANIQNKSDLDDDRCMDSGSCDEKNLRTALNALRSALANAMVTTYTYDPLIGITSMTDPKGYTIYYEYDDLNRLVRVKDEDGNIMSENKYHYLLDN